ncbi:Ig-like domain-containing protein [Vibrio algivorus]|uniref:Big-1 domain-containing protein n=1 Tax=Vibrio algivorus TaxID=1667024 RepID=A0A557PC54_9VIBR|nr:Ig-like domain-containing protein [Vibrio algivorus]TVO38208.1 hypothetical protein FOF44_05075 [Vibrio algivorus]
MFNVLKLLPNPRIPAYDDGIIDKADCDADNVEALIFYTPMSVDDIINLYWDNDEIHSYIITAIDVERGEAIPFSLPQSILTTGSHIISYKVTDVHFNSATSSNMPVYVDSDHYASKIAAPIIVGAENGCLSLDDVEINNGAIIDIPSTESLTQNIGHFITIEWNGFDANGSPTINGNTSEQELITADMSNGFNWIVPKEVVLLSSGANVYYYIAAGSERIYSEMTTISIGECAQQNIILSSNTNTINANDQDIATITATVLNNGSLESNVMVHWSASLGNVTPSSSLTGIDGTTSTSFTSSIAGNAMVTGTLSSGESDSQPILVSPVVVTKTLKIMGARISFNGYGRYRRPRLVALDSSTLEPVICDWRYLDGTGIVSDSSSFIDFKPDQVLIVSASGYTTATINISNIAGNGSYIDNGIGPGAFSALTDDGVIYSWGNEYYGGIAPESQSGTYDRIFQNSHAFVAQNKETNRLTAWGEQQQGGELPADIVNRTDILTVRGGFASMAVLASNYPYVATWGEIEDGNLVVPNDIASLSNIQLLAATSNAWAIVDGTGKAYAWGNEAEGGYIPNPIYNLNTITDLVATEKAFSVLFDDGQVASWGDDSFGADESSLVGDSGIVQIFASDAAFAALFDNGNLKVWGDPLMGGELPDGLLLLENVVDVCSTFGAFAALLGDGTVIAWGSVHYGAYYDSVVDQLQNIVSLASTGAAFTALKSDGRVIAWGNESDGGDLDSVNNDLYNILAIYGNTRAFSALREDNTIICWGELDSGAVGALVDLNGQISYRLE